MVKTLFLFPTEAEAAGLRRRCGGAAVAIVGVGMAEAAAGTVRALSGRSPRRAVLCGIAGVCAGDLRAGDVVEVVEDSVAALPAAYRRSYSSPRRTVLKAARAVTNSRNEQPQLVGIIINEINRDWTTQESSGRTVDPNLDELPRKNIGQHAVLRQFNQNILVINMFHRNDF